MNRDFKNCLHQQCGRNAHSGANGKLGYCSMHYQRFKKHGDSSVVKQTPSPAKDWLMNHVNYSSDECLKWPFAIGKDGYGRVHRFNAGTLTTASHLMCEFAHGKPPSELHETAHSCGNGHNACVNPEHLYWATSKENKLDKLKHKTDARGSKSVLSKLTEDSVREIRKLFPSESHASIARKFSVSRALISQIYRGERWGWFV